MKFKVMGIAAGLAMGLVSVSAVDAALILDVRLDTANPDKKNAVVAPDDVVTLQVYAMVTGVGAGAEGVWNAFFNLVSLTDNVTPRPKLNGDLGGLVLASPFNASGSQVGTVQNLVDVPTDLDIGKPGGLVTISGNGDFVFPRAASMVVVGTAIPDGQEFLLATFTFTADSLLASGSAALINAVAGVQSGAGQPALWQEDGAARNVSNGTYGVGTPVTLVIPEPASLALLGLGSGLMLLRRRKA